MFDGCIPVSSSCTTSSPLLVQPGGGQHGLVMVPEEVWRARFLRCKQCGQTGAAMGCEVRSCKGTFHLPCAMMQASADGDEGCEDACSWCAPQCKPGGVCAVIVYCCVLFLLAGCSLWASSTSRFNPALPTAPACPLCWSNHQTTCERSLRRTAPSLTASAGSCFAPTTPPSAWGWRLKTSSSGGACCGGCYATASPCCPLQMPAARQPPSRRPADDQPPARPAQQQQQQQQQQVRQRG